MLRVPWQGTPPARRRPSAVLFDRDGTLVHDEPRYNGDPALVRPIAGARAAVARVRDAGVPVGVVSNQSGLGRGLLTEAQVRAVNARVDELVGPFGTWRYCPHHPADGCPCRKPSPLLVHAAAADLGVEPHRVVVIGDIASDVGAAEAAGGWGVLVPTVHTDPAEIAAAACVAPDLGHAVRIVLGTP
jgi:histidinol-phosphate phosphatase family protein